MTWERTGTKAGVEIGLVGGQISAFWDSGCAADVFFLDGGRTDACGADVDRVVGVNDVGGKGECACGGAAMGKDAKVRA
jgi:hypothetical protein